MSNATNRPEREPAKHEVPDLPLSDAEAETLKGGGFGFPDVAKTPSPAGPIPIPYPNIPR